jgi:murein endopeptidase
MLDPEAMPTRAPAPWANPAAAHVPLPASNQCGFVQLPQNPAGGGYYTYGTPARGAGQYGLPDTIDLIRKVATRQTDQPFGVGNISLADGGRFKPHKTHRDGAGIDIRPMRADAAQVPTDWRRPGYDRAAMQRLIDAFQATGMVRNIWFNDPAIKGVRPLKGHDNHFHVDVRSPCIKR